MSAGLVLRTEQFGGWRCTRSQTSSAGTNCSLFSCAIPSRLREPHMGTHWVARACRRNPERSRRTNRIMAESEGFEPPIPFQVRRLSRPMPSTTRPALRGINCFFDCKAKSIGQVNSPRLQRRLLALCQIANDLHFAFTIWLSVGIKKVVEPDGRLV